MITQKYEHHLDIKNDKLCPFKFRTCDDIYNTVCNWHHNIEILLVTRGKGRIQYGSDDLEIEPHNIITVNSGALHRPYSESGITFSYVIIDERFFAENGLDINIISFERVIKNQNAEKIFLNACDMYREYKASPSPINTAAMRHIMLSLILELCKYCSPEASKGSTSHFTSEKYVKSALEYIEKHYSEPFSLEDVAEVCGITKYHLSREFKRYTGQTIFTFVNMLRCRKAEHCILNGMTVTEAACESGFDSVSYFSRTYKRITGRSPSCEKGK